MKTVIWKCDGCAQTKEMAKNDPPSDWASVTVTIEGLKSFAAPGANGDRAYDLCPHCQSHLSDRANPLTWPRHKAEAA